MAKKKNKVKVDLYEHEALHSTNMVSEILEDHLVNHHYYHSKVNEEYNKLIDKAGELLQEAYQSIANNSEFYKALK